MKMSDKVAQALTSASFMAELEQIKNEAVEELKRSIQENFYDTYEPKKYHRTMQFLNSVRGEIVIEGGIARIKIFLDSALMNHPSYVDGLISYVPPLLYWGHEYHGDKWHSDIYSMDNPDYFHYYPGRPDWFEEALTNIKIMVWTRVKKAMIRAIKPKAYR